MKVGDWVVKWYNQSWNMRLPFQSASHLATITMPNQLEAHANQLQAHAEQEMNSKALLHTEVGQHPFVIKVMLLGSSIGL